MTRMARIVIVVVLAVCGLGVTLAVSSAARPEARATYAASGDYFVHLPIIMRQEIRPSGDLLYNGDFEGTFHKYQDHDGLIVADGWTPWWVPQQATDPAWKNRRPEWKQATLSIDPFRIRTGASAQQYFTFWGTHVGGVYQRVMVPPNARLRFSAWGHAWSSEQNAPRPSVNPTNVHMRIGIDRQGGTDWSDPGIVWSAEQNAIDVFVPFTVEAAALGGRVTVFFYSAPEEPRRHNDIYWDDVLLVFLSTDPNTPRDPNPDAAITFDPPQVVSGKPMTITASSLTPLAYVDLHLIQPDSVDVVPLFVGVRQEGTLPIWNWDWTHTPPISGTYRAVFLADGIAPAWADFVASNSSP